MFGFALAPLLKPLLIGAGTGALGGLLTGKDPLKGALMGGVTGGLLGSVPALGAGGVGAGAASASSAGATGLVGAGNATLGSGIGAGLGGGAGGGVGTYGGNMLTPYTPEIGMANSFNMATNAPSIQASGITGSTGELGANMAFNGMPVANTTENLMLAGRPYQEGGLAGGVMPDEPSMFDSLYDKVSPYMNVRDLTGAAQVASQYQDRPMPTPQSGRITEGRAPQGNDVMALLQTMKLPERRRISLI